MPRAARVYGERRNARSAAKLDLCAHLHWFVSRVAAPWSSVMHSVTPVEGALVRRTPPTRTSTLLESAFRQGWPRRPSAALFSIGCTSASPAQELLYSADYDRLHGRLSRKSKSFGSPPIWKLPLGKALLDLKCASTEGRRIYLSLIEAWHFTKA